MKESQSQSNSTRNKAISVITWIGLAAGFLFVVFVYFDEEQIDKNLALSQKLEACNMANMKIINPESFFTEDDIKHINETGSPVKQADGTIMTPFEAQIKAIKSRPVIDCEKLRKACEQDLFSAECQELSTSAT